MEQWDTIYKNNASKMLGVCRRYIKDDQLAEDLMHNAFITAMNKAETYSGTGSFEGWLRKIAVNTALLHLRKNKNHIISENEPIENYPEPIEEQEYASESQKNTIVEADFNKEELLEVIDQLPDHHKMVFNLYVMDGYKHKKIGTMLDISEGTSKSHLARARKKIQQLLFEKAENKNKKRAFFFLFFSKENYIDKIYKKAFDSFEIQPKKQPELKDGNSIINTQQKFSLFSKRNNNKTVLITSIVAALAIGTLVVFLYLKNVSVLNEEDIIPEQIMIEQGATANPNTKVAPVLIQEDSTVKQTNIILAEPKVSNKVKKEITNPVKDKTTSGNDKKENPVVVKKPFVVHKSIIAHDTVIQKVPVNDGK